MFESLFRSFFSNPISQPVDTFAGSGSEFSFSRPEMPVESDTSGSFSTMTSSTVGGTVEATSGPEGVEVEITTETSGDGADIGGVLTGGGTNGDETLEETVVLGDGPADLGGLGDLDGMTGGFGSEPAPDLSFGGGDWTPRPAIEDLWTESDAPDPLDEMEITPPATMGGVITETGFEVTASAGPEGVSTSVETSGDGDAFGGFTIGASNGDVTEVQTGMFDGLPMVPFVEDLEEDADQTGEFELDGFFG